MGFVKFIFFVVLHGFSFALVDFGMDETLHITKFLFVNSGFILNIVSTRYLLIDLRLC